MAAREHASTVVAEGFAYAECPRWHDGRLWFSDQYGGSVVTLEPGGAPQEVLAVPGRPAGLGWTPDGRLLVVAMEEHRLLVADHGHLEVLAELAAFHGGPSNDMVVDRQGRAYVGNIGFDYYAGQAPTPTVLTLVDLDGTVRVVAEDLLVPNGSVLSPDGSVLVVAESFGHRLTAFDVAADGGLSGRRSFAELGDLVPDGICLDAAGAIWAATVAGGIVRVEEGGQVTDHVTTTRRHAYACVLGGPEGRTLYACTADADDPASALALRSSAIETLEVAVPGPG